MGDSGMVEVELENVVQISQAEVNLPFPQNKHLLPNVSKDILIICK